MKLMMLLSVFVLVITVCESCKCYIKSEEPVKPVIKSPQSYTYLKASDLPSTWDWRNINGTNYCGNTLTQQNPNVCGSCWAEASTGALSDRYQIAVQNKIKFRLSVQTLINFNAKITGGSCNGGDDVKSYEFMYKYGIVDDTCGPFIGLNWLHGFDVAGKEDVKEVQNHQCFICNWNGVCDFLKSDEINLYGVDEFGSVTGVDQMKAEIYSRGPISCLINSVPTEFDQYRGGIITCSDPNDQGCNSTDVDHYVVVAGWGIDSTSGMEYWIGRNSYGTYWGEGAGGGWFRLKLGSNILNLESNPCGYGVPGKSDVQRIVQQYNDSL